MTWETSVLLFIAGLSAGFIDAIAGGGGLISLPALMAAGLPPQLALGTNKMQSTWGTLMAVRKYAKAGLVKWTDVRLTVLVTFVFACLGTWVVTLVSNEALKWFVPWMLLGIAVYVLLSPRLGKTPAKARLSLGVFAMLAGSVLGFYDGFFGPGTGTFWALACISLLGLELTRATAFTKVANLTSNVASVMVFVMTDRVHYPIALVMIAGQLIGGRLGAHMAIKHGAGFIRVIFVAVVLAMVAKLLWDQIGSDSTSPPVLDPSSGQAFYQNWAAPGRFKERRCMIADAREMSMVRVHRPFIVDARATADTFRRSLKC